VQGTVSALLNEDEHQLTNMGDVVVPSIGQRRISCAHRRIAIYCLVCNSVPALKLIVRDSATSRGIKIGSRPGNHAATVEGMLRMEIDVFLALLLLKTDVWNATCSVEARMSLENHGARWQIDHIDHLGGTAKGDTAAELERCVGWRQGPLTSRLHTAKSNAET
jgi:hypothetical protein